MRAAWSASFAFPELDVAFGLPRGAILPSHGGAWWPASQSVDHRQRLLPSHDRGSAAAAAGASSAGMCLCTAGSTLS